MGVADDTDSIPRNPIERNGNTLKWRDGMIDRIEDLEDLLLATLDAVSRFRVGQHGPNRRGRD